MSIKRGVTVKKILKLQVKRPRIPQSEKGLMAGGVSGEETVGVPQTPEFYWDAWDGSSNMARTALSSACGDPACMTKQPAASKSQEPKILKSHLELT